MESFPKVSFSLCCILALWLSIIVEGAPSYNSEGLGDDQQGILPTPKSNKRITIQSVLGRSRGKAGDLDPQTQNDMRILSLFEHELNKIFSCYVRLSCPRTRSPQVIAECEELRSWPLYHQVMRMAGIKRYPYQNYAPQTNSPTTASISHLTRNHITPEEGQGTVRTRRQQRQRRTNSNPEVVTQIQ